MSGPLTLSNHLHDRPQLAPSIARLVVNRLKLLFGHPLWGDNDPAIDPLLVSAQPQEALFVQIGLTELYVLTGN